MVPRGRLLFWVAVVALPFAVLAGAYAPAGPVAAALIALLAVVVGVDALRGRSALDGLRPVAPPLTRLALHRDGTLELRLQNLFGRPRRLRVAPALPEEIVPAVDEIGLDLPADQEWSKIQWACRPTRRGVFAVSAVYVEAPSPWGFWAFRHRFPLEAEIRVYPDLQKDARRLSLLLRGAMGTHAQRQVGKGREFEKLRDYVPGDGSEDIHWKATARRGKPVTKVFQIERTQEVYVAIDVSRLSTRAAALEKFISTALLLGLSAEQQGDLFGLLAFSDRVEKFVRARNGSNHFHACREAIHALQPRPVNPDFQEVFTFLRLRLRRRALLIFLTALDDPVVAESFQKTTALIAGQHLIVAAMIAPAGVEPLFSARAVQTTDDLYDCLGGHLRWHALEEFGSRLRHSGVRFLSAPAGDLVPRLVTEYLTIKRRQLL
jgi:uncharacterized protein (DUF58 family)